MANKEIRNPIHVARLILEHSTRPLSLRRVPPNLLVGAGATDFAAEKGVPVMPPDSLISVSAHDRYQRWRADIEKTYFKSSNQVQRKLDLPRTPSDEDHSLEHEQDAMDTVMSLPGSDDPTSRHLAPFWNESQPYSPQSSEAASPELRNKLDIVSETGISDLPRDHIRTGTEWKLLANDLKLQYPSDNLIDLGSSEGRHHIMQLIRNQKDLVNGYGSKPTDQGNDGQGLSDCGDQDDDGSRSYIDDDTDWTDPRPLPQRSRRTLSVTDSADKDCLLGDPLIPIIPRPENPSSKDSEPQSPLQDTAACSKANMTASHIRSEDNITDTVGVIAIDCFGNIAAGSSSGGIGMKHSGRVGPAALVGIGTAVVPVEPEDSDKTSVAAVTSGTGEHMATTMAAQSCACRIYSSERRSKHGGTESTDDDSAIKSFVERDFMGKAIPIGRVDS